LFLFHLILQFEHHSFPSGKRGGSEWALFFRDIGDEFKVHRRSGESIGVPTGGERLT